MEKIWCGLVENDIKSNLLWALPAARALRYKSSFADRSSLRAFHCDH